ncbi:MAG: TetR/AcrR family transcriptional regulator [Oscillospiraceae bacterium]|jgi:transcriptional regulator, tetR family|nr:TetR/AcrR family transcriptional regulator [Oscillospiraceae bacterium]
MGETNKKEAVAALHRARIMTAAEKLFSEKGYEQTTIEDISKESEYSRRTIYAYYESKDDILHCIIEKGLQALKTDIENAANDNAGFTDAYRAVCRAMRKYRREYPHSLGRLNRSGDEEIGQAVKSAAVKNILRLGTEINETLEALIIRGQENGEVRKDIIPTLTVYVLWSSIDSLLALAGTKGKFICAQNGMTEEKFLDYGFRQIVNSILEARI